MKKLNKKGTITVMAILFFMALMIAIWAFISASCQVAVKGGTDSLAKVWGRSVLGEYDRNLHYKYGIYGFYGYDGQISKKIDYYARYTFTGKNYIRYQGCGCCLCDYSLGKTDVFKKQVVRMGKAAAAGKLAGIKKKNSSESSGSGRINNNSIIASLPSSGQSSGASIGAAAGFMKNSRSADELIHGTTDKCLEMTYLFSFFRDSVNSHGVGKTFFRNEIEYVVCGEKSDGANQTAIRRRIIATRTLLNMAFLETDAVKRNEALAAAEIITPGPAALVTQQAILAAWAIIESENDYRLLMNKKPVPYVKTDKSWATDIESAVNNKSSGYIDTGNRQGADYEDYLTVFAYFTNEQTRLLRMMDLVQINMKYLYYGDFLIKEYNSGLAYNLTVNGKKYEYKEEY